ncbi:MAG: ABC-ATPase UvrA, partial [Syntrophobacteraceae bacterium]|nr:ABC-ATPase UvrA [Syntrophobacteraceae bacterium]
MDTPLSPMDEIIIRGARQNNLKNIDVRIPRHQMTVITGVSGSGKSSLAFDVLFAEAHRRFVEALSTHSRHFLQKLDAPQVDEIQGLSPAIAIQQRRLPFDPRATVGSITEILDHLRLIFARLGTLYCPSCQNPVRAYTIPEMVTDLLEQWSEGRRLMVLAPWQPVREKELPRTLKQLRRDGFARIRMEGKIYELDSTAVIPRRPAYRLEVVVDRLVLNAAKSRRLAESLELALKIGNGMAVAADLEGDERRYSESCLCVTCGREMVPPSPYSLSFRHPGGMCPECKGMGFTTTPERPEGPEGEEPPEESAELTGWTGGWERLHLGFVPETLLCRLCAGTRLNETARSVRLGGLGIHDVSRLSLPAARDWLKSLDLSPTETVIASRPRTEILQRLDNLLELGLAYLTLERSAHSLSGGEAQRIRL